MKGDDCQFDHSLSKYPCDQYVSKGFCSRSDDCLFSHKVSLYYYKALLILNNY